MQTNPSLRQTPSLSGDGRKASASVGTWASALDVEQGAAGMGEPDSDDSEASQQRAAHALSCGPSLRHLGDDGLSRPLSLASDLGALEKPPAKSGVAAKRRVQIQSMDSDLPEQPAGRSAVTLPGQLNSPLRAPGPHPPTAAPRAPSFTSASGSHTAQSQSNARVAAFMSLQRLSAPMGHVAPDGLPGLHSAAWYNDLDSLLEILKSEDWYNKSLVWHNRNIYPPPTAAPGPPGAPGPSRTRPPPAAPPRTPTPDSATAALKSLLRREYLHFACHPLTIAAASGSVRIVDELLKAMQEETARGRLRDGAITWAGPPEGLPPGCPWVTPLAAAALSGSGECVRLLAAAATRRKALGDDRSVYGCFRFRPLTVAQSAEAVHALFACYCCPADTLRYSLCDAARRIAKLEMGRGAGARALVQHQQALRQQQDHTVGRSAGTGVVSETGHDEDSPPCTPRNTRTSGTIAAAAAAKPDAASPQTPPAAAVPGPTQYLTAALYSGGSAATATATATPVTASATATPSPVPNPASGGSGGSGGDALPPADSITLITAAPGTTGQRAARAVKAAELMLFRARLFHDCLGRPLERSLCDFQPETLAAMAALSALLEHGLHPDRFLTHHEHPHVTSTSLLMVVVRNYRSAITAAGAGAVDYGYGVVASPGAGPGAAGAGGGGHESVALPLASGATSTMLASAASAAYLGPGDLTTAAHDALNALVAGLLSHGSVVDEPPRHVSPQVGGFHVAPPHGPEEPLHHAFKHGPQELVVMLLQHSRLQPEAHEELLEMASAAAAAGSGSGDGASAVPAEEEGDGDGGGGGGESGRDADHHASVARAFYSKRPQTAAEAARRAARRARRLPWAGNRSSPLLAFGAKMQEALLEGSLPLWLHSGRFTELMEDLIKCTIASDAHMVTADLLWLVSEVFERCMGREFEGLAPVGVYSETGASRAAALAGPAGGAATPGAPAAAAAAANRDGSQPGSGKPGAAVADPKIAVAATTGPSSPVPPLDAAIAIMPECSVGGDGNASGRDALRSRTSSGWTFHQAASAAGLAIASGLAAMFRRDSSGGRRRSAVDDDGDGRGGGNPRSTSVDLSAKLTPPPASASAVRATSLVSLPDSRTSSGSGGSSFLAAPDSDSDDGVRVFQVGAAAAAAARRGGLGAAVAGSGARPRSLLPSPEDSEKLSIVHSLYRHTADAITGLHQDLKDGSLDGPLASITASLAGGAAAAKATRLAIANNAGLVDWAALLRLVARIAATTLNPPKSFGAGASQISVFTAAKAVNQLLYARDWAMDGALIHGGPGAGPAAWARSMTDRDLGGGGGDADANGGGDAAPDWRSGSVIDIDLLRAIARRHPHEAARLLHGMDLMRVELKGYRWDSIPMSLDSDFYAVLTKGERIRLSSRVPTVAALSVARAAEAQHAATAAAAAAATGRRSRRRGGSTVMPVAGEASTVAETFAHGAAAAAAVPPPLQEVEPLGREDILMGCIFSNMWSVLTHFLLSSTQLPGYMGSLQRLRQRTYRYAVTGQFMQYGSIPLVLCMGLLLGLLGLLARGLQLLVWLAGNALLGVYGRLEVRLQPAMQQVGQRLQLNRLGRGLESVHRGVSKVVRGVDALNVVPGSAALLTVRSIPHYLSFLGVLLDPDALAELWLGVTQHYRRPRSRLASPAAAGAAGAGDSADAAAAAAGAGAGVDAGGGGGGGGGDGGPAYLSGRTTRVVVQRVPLTCAAAMPAALLYKLASSPQVNGELFASPVMRAVITWRWQHYTRYFLLLQFIEHLLYMAAFMVYAFSLSYRPALFASLLGELRTAVVDRQGCSQVPSGMQQFLLVALGVMTLSCVMQELRQIMFFKLGWLKQPWNLLDFASSAIVGLLISLHLSCKSDADTLRGLASVEVALLFIRLLYFAMADDRLGSFFSPPSRAGTVAAQPSHHTDAPRSVAVPRWPRLP
ncbi:hypothetical protein GPECTOR_56g364 [Gonium pectorale]|uniref:Ion transport domain-containing protein n=1 Tax=Gonium pectorale TaxID=33097 RepID=A0A150G620_GONPE|nr:hypothetical protein GPECTOR_56g364 [Gonium pectorale]|eukprot:KXZ45268.1 hypothetical protein GPECTOR_56g364 [Gonium pectorale]